MSVGAIIILVAVFLVFVFEVISLIRTIIKRKRAKKEVSATAEDNNNNKEGSVQ